MSASCHFAPLRFTQKNFHPKTQPADTAILTSWRARVSARRSQRVERGRSTSREERSIRGVGAGRVAKCAARHTGSRWQLLSGNAACPARTDKALFRTSSAVRAPTPFHEARRRLDARIMSNGFSAPPTGTSGLKELRPSALHRTRGAGTSSEPHRWLPRCTRCHSPGKRASCRGGPRTPRAVRPCVLR